MLGKFDPKTFEAKWAKAWEQHGTYRFDEKDHHKPVYSIDSPPPFTSGALHMGHFLSYSYFDFAARYKRMRGYNVFYPQGWDCQGFPTEVKVEQKYGKDLPRREFKAKCIAFTEENIKKMRSQMERAGFSPDWGLEYRTMDPSYHQKVQYSVLKMYENKRVYREKHPVLFCTYCRSAIAKAETEDEARTAKLNTIAFPLKGGGEILIATTRPELLHADVAVFVNPTDARHKTLVGKTAIVPIHNQEVPIKADPDVDSAFGTGIVMVSSFGDKTDVTWVYRHNLPVVDAVDEGGRAINAGPYNGHSLHKVREMILSDLKDKGFLRDQKDLPQVVKTHDRCKKTVEYLRSQQWFVKVKDRKEQIIQAARSMSWIPGFTLQYLLDWANGLEYDWVISRQRVYGTPLPFWYCEKCSTVYPADYQKLPVDPAHDAPPRQACPCGGKLVGETSTADCWLDSSITPLAICGWPDAKPAKLLERAYPASLRPQGIEIIRTWAFYTIARCLELTGKPPFRELLIHGSVLGKDGRKMSKSLGNFEDPEVILAKYPADALRQWAALSGALGKDRVFDYKDVERGRAFLIKYWNASRFVQKALEGYKHPAKGHPPLRVVDRWLLSRLHRTIQEVTEALDHYDYYAAITALHTFTWQDVCDLYLEEIKHRVYSEETDKQTKENQAGAQYTLYTVFHALTKMLAPVVSFTAEEVYHDLFGEKGSVHQAAWPTLEEAFINNEAEEICNTLHQVLTLVRRYKASNSLALSEAVSVLQIQAPQRMLHLLTDVQEELQATSRAKQIALIPIKDDAALSVNITP